MSDPRQPRLPTAAIDTGPAANPDIPIPSAYAPQLALARTAHPELADLYLHHVSVGDPLAGAVASSMAGFPAAHGQAPLTVHDLANASLPDDAPSCVREFLNSLPHNPPEPFDPVAVGRARDIYQAHSDIFIQAFVIATIRNLSTLRAIAPDMTGVYASERGLRPLRYAARHFHELMVPGSLEERGPAWKLSVHIRLVHALARSSLSRSGSWDTERYGVPIHAAHLALGSANYSTGTMRYAERLGVPLDPLSRRGFMQIWHYASLLLGTPPELLFGADETATRQFASAAHLCEPPPGPAAARIVNAVIRSLPPIAGSPSPAAARRLVARAYRVSRALLPRDTCDALGFPDDVPGGLLPRLRFRHAIRRAWFDLNPHALRRWKRAQAAFFDNTVLPDRPDYSLSANGQGDRSGPTSLPPETGP